MKVKESIFDTLRVIARDQSTHPKVFMSAAIVKNNKIVSIGVNRMDKTDSFQAKFGKNKDSIFPHAEILAIKNSLKIISIDDLKDCILYVCRLKYDSTKKKKLIDGKAFCCDGCLRAAKSFELKNIIYTLNEDENNYEKYGIYNL